MRLLAIVLLLLSEPQVHGFYPFSFARSSVKRVVTTRRRMTEEEPFSMMNGASISRRDAMAAAATATASGILLPPGVQAQDTTTSKTVIPTVQLGNGSLSVSGTIQGYWQLAGGHGRYRESDALDNMQAHFKAGMTTLDTADIYGPSELIVGKFVKSQPKAIPLTKVRTYKAVPWSIAGRYHNNRYRSHTCYCFFPVLLLSIPGRNNARRSQTTHSKGM